MMSATGGSGERYGRPGSPIPPVAAVQAVLEHAEQLREQQAADFQQRRRAEVAAAKERLEQEEELLQYEHRAGAAGGELGSSSDVVGGEKAEGEHGMGAHASVAGKVKHALVCKPMEVLHKVEAARADAAGEFQRREWEAVQAARARLDAERAAGKHVEARYGHVRVEDA